MLDFYWCRDEEVFPEWPDETRHLASFSMEEFNALHPLWKSVETTLIPSFHKDGRLSQAETVMLDEQVKRFVAETSQRQTKDPLLGKLLALLSVAVSSDSGLLWFCD